MNDVLYEVFGADAVGAVVHGCASVFSPTMPWLAGQDARLTCDSAFVLAGQEYILKYIPKYVLYGVSA